MDASPILVSTEKAAAAFDLNERTLRNLAEGRQIPFYRIGKRFRFSLPEILEATRQAPVPPAK